MYKQINRVYWTDALEDIIESCYLDGSDRRVLVSTNINHPFGITIDQNNIYWSDWGHGSVFSVNKNTGECLLVLVFLILKLDSVQ